MVKNIACIWLTVLTVPPWINEKINTHFYSNNFSYSSLTEYDHDLKHKPRQHETPLVPLDRQQHQQVDRRAQQAERQHQHVHHDGQRRATVTSCVIPCCLCRCGQVVTGCRDGYDQVEGGEDDAEDADEGVEGAAAPAHAHVHLGFRPLFIYMHSLDLMSYPNWLGIIVHFPTKLLSLPMHAQLFFRDFRKIL